jgi:hypothetical protein
MFSFIFDRHRPNLAAPGNGAVTVLFHAGHPWRAVPEQRRYALMKGRMQMNTLSYQNSFSILVCFFVACWFLGPAPMQAGDLDQPEPPVEQTGAARYSTNTFAEHFVDTNHLKLRLEPNDKTNWVAGYVTDTGQGRLAKLYQQLLRGSCSQGFVSFERVIVSPKGGPRPPAPTAIAFCWADARYLIASWRGAAVTNAEALASGDKLYGFDGEAYWCWHRNPPCACLREDRRTSGLRSATRFVDHPPSNLQGGGRARARPLPA